MRIVVFLVAITASLFSSAYTIPTIIELCPIVDGVSYSRTFTIAPPFDGTFDTGEVTLGGVRFRITMNAGHYSAMFQKLDRTVVGWDFKKLITQEEGVFDDENYFLDGVRMIAKWRKPMTYSVAKGIIDAVSVDGHAVNCASVTNKTPFGSISISTTPVYTENNYIKNLTTTQIVANSGSATIAYPCGAYYVSGSKKVVGKYTPLVDDIEGNGDTPLHADTAGTGIIVNDYYEIVFEGTSVKTEWVFNQSAYDTPAGYTPFSSPKVYINSTCVCPGHTTDHIIPYSMIEIVEYDFDPITRIYTFDFTMTIEKAPNAAGGSCLFRCWVYDNDEGWDDATVKQEVSGNENTVARFRLTYNKWNGERTLSLR